MAMSHPSVKIAPISITTTQLSPQRHAGSSGKGRRQRSNSIMKVEEVGEGQDQVLDQSVYANMNVEWVNRKGSKENIVAANIAAKGSLCLGAWLMHPLLILSGKAMIDSIPGMTREISWTAVNLLYMAVSSWPIFIVLPQ